MTGLARQSFGIWKELRLTNLAEIAERPLPQPEQKKNQRRIYCKHRRQDPTISCPVFPVLTPEEIAQTAPEPETRLSVSANERRHKFAVMLVHLDHGQPHQNADHSIM